MSASFLYACFLACFLRPRHARGVRRVGGHRLVALIKIAVFLYRFCRYREKLANAF